LKCFYHFRPLMKSVPGTAYLIAFKYTHTDYYYPCLSGDRVMALMR
jgi:hypothetical protein